MRHILIILSILLLSYPLFGQDTGVLFQREINGELEWFEDGDEDKEGKYEGGIENGEPISQGTFTWSDGNRYEGEFKDGKQNGQGTLIFTSGNKYEGEFKDGKYYGRGTFIWSHGDRYVGEFKDDKPNGQGTYTCSYTPSVR